MIFADDIALVSQEIAQLQEFLECVKGETNAAKIVHHLNSKKIKLILVNFDNYSTVEFVLKYNRDTWTLNKSLQRKIDGCYTRIFYMDLNAS